jgi:hypothetical protein
MGCSDIVLPTVQAPSRCVSAKLEPRARCEIKYGGCKRMVYEKGVNALIFNFV